MWLYTTKQSPKDVVLNPLRSHNSSTSHNWKHLRKKRTRVKTKGSLYQENSQNTKLHFQKPLKKEDPARKNS